MDTATGVWFRRDDYAGLFRRLAIDILDGLIVGCLCFGLLLVVRDSVPYRVLFAGWVGILFCYFVLLKRSRFGTVGYRLFGAKIVDMWGRVPGLWPLTLRMFFLVFGPLNYLMDILWLSSDAHRQALRDKFTQTYVVRKNAQPAGTGKLIYRYYEIFGYNFLFREIEAGRP
jgi:uncharacterized RDD family membrane protein YckC